MEFDLAGEEIFFNDIVFNWTPFFEQNRIQ